MLRPVRTRRDLPLALTLAALLLPSGAAASGAAIPGPPPNGVQEPGARSGRARLAMTLVDPAGERVPAVVVELRRLDGEQLARSVADGRGELGFVDLDPGTYLLVGRLPGSPPVRLTVDLRAGLNAVELRIPNPRSTSTAPAGQEPLEELYRLGRAAFVEGRYEAAAASARRLVARVERELRSGPEELAPAGGGEPLAGDRGRPPDVADQQLRRLEIASWRLLARSLLELGRLDEAVEAYDRRVELAPDEVQAWVDLGNVLAASGEMERALEALGRASRMAPEDARVQFTVGAALAQAERNQTAAAALEAAISLRPGFPEAHRLLGHVYARLGRFDEAVARLRTYLQQAPEAEDAEEVRELIRSLGGEGS